MCGNDAATTNVAMGRHLLELQSSNLTGKSRDEACHLPRSERVFGRAFGAAARIAVVLFETTRGMWRATDVRRGMANSRSQQVTCIVRRDWRDGLLHGAESRSQPGFVLMAECKDGYRMGEYEMNALFPYPILTCYVHLNNIG